MCPQTFDVLIDLLGRTESFTGRQIPVALQVFVFLRILGHGLSYHDMATMANMSPGSVAGIIARVSTAVVDWMIDFIQRSDEARRTATKRYFGLLGLRLVSWTLILKLLTSGILL